MPQIECVLTKHDVAVYDFTEVVVKVKGPVVANPFTDARVTAVLTDGSGLSRGVEGFCDSDQGDEYRVRFMPTVSGVHSLSLVYAQADGYTASWTGSFLAVPSGRKGLLRVDPEYRWNFQWEGTGEHYFWNGTTAYYLMGWKDEAVIREVIDRMSHVGVNRLRVLLFGRQDDRPWGVPVVNSDRFRMTLNPWPAKWPDDVARPEFDLTRFNLEHWRRYERMLEYARERDIVVSVIFHIGAQPLPVPFGPNDENEYRYYSYAASRLSAYSNITWDLGNEHDFHRNRFWVDETARFLRKADPYRHLLSVHNAAYYNAGLDMQLLQKWDAGLNGYLLGMRAEQAGHGHIVPQVIEEYGYEDHWEAIPGHRSADTRRRVAWEVYMAGGHQTNGESTLSGCGVAPDTGGGWVTGRGDGTMFNSFTHIRDFFQTFEWWKCEPRNDLISCYESADMDKLEYYYENTKPAVDIGAMCLAEEGRTYVFYLPNSGSLVARIADGNYAASRYNPREGSFEELVSVQGPLWNSPVVPGEQPGTDWVYLLRAID